MGDTDVAILRLDVTPSQLASVAPPRTTKSAEDRYVVEKERPAYRDTADVQ